jgi:hypothetical protein
METKSRITGDLTRQDILLDLNQEEYDRIIKSEMARKLVSKTPYLLLLIAIALLSFFILRAKAKKGL